MARSLKEVTDGASTARGEVVAPPATKKKKTSTKSYDATALTDVSNMEVPHEDERPARPADLKFRDEDERNNSAAQIAKRASEQEEWDKQYGRKGRVGDESQTGAAAGPSTAGVPDSASPADHWAILHAAHQELQKHLAKADDVVSQARSKELEHRSKAEEHGGIARGLLIKGQIEEAQPHLDAAKEHEDAAATLRGFGPKHLNKLNNVATIKTHLDNVRRALSDPRGARTGDALAGLTKASQLTKSTNDWLNSDLVQSITKAPTGINPSMANSIATQTKSNPNVPKKTRGTAMVTIGKPGTRFSPSTRRRVEATPELLKQHENDPQYGTQHPVTKAIREALQRTKTTPKVTRTATTAGLGVTTENRPIVDQAGNQVAPSRPAPVREAAGAKNDVAAADAKANAKETARHENIALSALRNRGSIPAASVDHLGPAGVARVFQKHMDFLKSQEGK